MQGVLLSSKSIRDLMKLENPFYIPSYQRGYRWTDIQVKELLEDLKEFMLQKQSRDEVYWLQPVIIKNAQNKWELIDGQQRLTTIYLILKVFTTYMSRQNEPYKLEYQSRKDSADFLHNITSMSEQDVSNIDYQYMLNAYRTIDEWITKTFEDDISEFSSTVKSNVRVIWYEIDQETDAIELFARTNSGKIPLTNAELIKAVFLSRSNLTDGQNSDKYIQLKQIEIANQWDQIEYSLQNNAFWYFLQNSSDNNDSARIEWLFELVVTLLNTEVPKGVPYYTFHVFNTVIEKSFYSGESKEEIINKLWKQIFEVYQTLVEWYENRKFYHYIGYLLTTGITIKELFRESYNKNKKEFEDYLLSRIADQFQNIDVDKLNYTKNKKEITRTLLLFNIFTLQNDENSNQRFDFERYKKDQWDIEHIHAKQNELPMNKDEQNELLQEFKQFVDDDGLVKEIDTFIEQTDSIDFESLYEKVDDYFSDGTFDVNALSNLTLLDQSTNRSYKNVAFPMKRQEIISRDRTGTYIPPCTKNVFLKYYSHRIQNMNFWSKKDREDYLKSVKQELESIL